MCPKKAGRGGARMTEAQKYALFATLAQIPRTGWVERNVPHPESVAEHIYGCWLLGYFLLPETATDASYDKQTVLQMLLLHDLPEAVTGDIPRPVKKQDPVYYDELERRAAQDSLLSGNCTASARALWEEWVQQASYNALVAKDIDDLQAVFTCRGLQKRYPGLLADEDVAMWMQSLQNLKTETGRQTAERMLKEYLL